MCIKYSNCFTKCNYIYTQIQKLLGIKATLQEYTNNYAVRRRLYSTLDTTPKIWGGEGPFD